MSAQDSPDTIVLIHGFWVTPRSWKDWIPHYEKKGFTVLAPVENVWNAGAVLGGLVHLKGFSGGSPFPVRLRFADIWGTRNGKWQVIYTHVSKPAGG